MISPRRRSTEGTFDDEISSTPRSGVEVLFFYRDTALFKALDKNPDDAKYRDRDDRRCSENERTTERTDRRTIPLDFFSRAPIPPRLQADFECVADAEYRAFLQLFSAANVQFFLINVTTIPGKEIEFFLHRVRKFRFSPKRGEKANLLDHDCRRTTAN